MARLFDTSDRARQLEDVRRSRDEVKVRAAEVSQLLSDHKDLDVSSAELGRQLDEAYAVQSIRYKRYRRPGSPWQVEHSRVGDDYVYQVFPIRTPVLGWKDILTLMIGAMDVIFPRSVQINYRPPKPEYAVKFYTVRVKDVAKLPGWEPAIERALVALSSIEAWPAIGSSGRAP